MTGKINIKRKKSAFLPKPLKIPLFVTITIHSFLVI